MSKSIKITSIRCPDCGGSVEPAEGQNRTRCPYCNAVLHIEGMEDKNSNIKNTSASSEKTTPSSGNKSTVPTFLAFTRFDYIVLALTVIGMFWTMWSTGNEFFMIIVAVVGVTFVGARTIIRGQIYQNKYRWK